MKKVLSIFAVVVFMGALTVPVFASNDLNPVVIQVNDENPKKKSSTKATTKQADKKASGDCTTPCGEKKATSDCATPCGEKKAKACGDKDKK